jgi:hypothetical protein
MRILKENFPQVFTVVNWAKGRYRSQCIFTPYLNGRVGRAEKLLVADKAYDFGLQKQKITEQYADMPSRNELVALVKSC